MNALLLTYTTTKWKGRRMLLVFVLVLACLITCCEEVSAFAITGGTSCRYALFNKPQQVNPKDAIFHSSATSLHDTKTELQHVYKTEIMNIPTDSFFKVVDITPKIREFVERTGVKEGTVHILARHTTTAITINEYESQLIIDMEAQMMKYAPSKALGGVYYHDDLDSRPATQEDSDKIALNWPEEKGGVEAWRAQEPINCQAHLQAQILGTSETIPITEGDLAIGKWQFLMMVEMDGPRADRTIAVQVHGMK